jgi:LysR family transcriptional regulator, glycine cleavage system transcriptional activator
MRYDELPPLAFLPTVETAGRLGSFKAAADALHITPSAVSQQVRAVEEALNITIFERRGRTVVLTSVGERYLRDVREALRELINAGRRTRQHTDRMALRLETIPFVAHEFLLPRVKLLHERFPNLQLSLQTSVAVTDLLTTPELDATIRLGAAPWPGGVLSRVIGPIETTVVCSPALARTINTMVDLKDHTILEIRGLQERGLVSGLRTAGIRVDPSQVQSFETYFETVRAAEHGLGVAVGMFPLTTEWVLDGRLAVPLLERYALPSVVALVNRPNDEERFPFAELASWLHEQYAALRPLPAGRIVPSESAMERAARG